LEAVSVETNVSPDEVFTKPLLTGGTTNEPIWASDSAMLDEMAEPISAAGNIKLCGNELGAPN